MIKQNGNATKKFQKKKGNTISFVITKIFKKCSSGTSNNNNWIKKKIESAMKNKMQLMHRKSQLLGGVTNIFQMNSSGLVAI